MKKIGILLFSIVISLVVLAVQPPSLPAQEKSLYVLYSGINANYLSLWLAKDAHYFADEGLNVQAVHVRGAGMLRVRREEDVVGDYPHGQESLTKQRENKSPIP